MKQYLALVSVLLTAALAVPIQGIAATDPVMADSAVLGETNSQRSLSTVENNVSIQSPITASSADVREVPSISGLYAFGGRRMLPYIGAGFSGGYSAEFNRSLGGAPPSQTDFGLRSQFGQIISPNEFQMGIRIPF